MMPKTVTFMTFNVSFPGSCITVHRKGGGGVVVVVMFNALFAFRKPDNQSLRRCKHKGQSSVPSTYTKAKCSGAHV